MKLANGPNNDCDDGDDEEEEDEDAHMVDGRAHIKSTENDQLIEVEATGPAKQWKLRIHGHC